VSFRAAFTPQKGGTYTLVADLNDVNGYTVRKTVAILGT
jgi:hypothetical protein